MSDPIQGLPREDAERRVLTQILADEIRNVTDDPVLLARVDQMVNQAGLLKDERSE